MSILDTARRAAGRIIPNKYRMPVRGRVVLITGAGSGIGREMALECARRGAARVIIWDMSARRAEETAELIRAAGGTAEHAVVDVTDEEAVAEAARETGEVHILFNNAGVVAGRDFLDNPQTSVDRTLDVNVRALFIVTRAFLDGMVQRDRGTVAVTASAAGLMGVVKATDYAASKWAAVGFAESLRMELKQRGYRVNCMSICPFFINTGMFAGAKTRLPWLLPILEPADVARAAVDGVEAGRHQLLIPNAVWLIFLMRLLPAPLFDRVCFAMGGDDSLDDLTGRPGDRV